MPDFKQRYEHQPLQIDHFGIRCKIREDGRILIQGIPDAAGEYDEIEVPASLIFKLSTLLKDTRKTAPSDIRK